MQKDERLTKDRENHNITAEFDQGFKTVHNSGINDFKGNLRSWCLIFFVRWIMTDSPKLDGAKNQRRQIDTGDCRKHVAVLADALVYHVAGDKDRADIVADGQQNLCFLLFNLVRLQKLADNLTSEREAKEKTCQEGIDSLRGDRNHLFYQWMQNLTEKREVVGGNQDIRDDRKGQKGGKNPVVPEQKPVSDPFHSVNRVCQHVTQYKDE